MSVNQSNNICTALNYLYASLLKFIDKYKFNEEQERYIKNLKLNLEIALPFGKYTTSKLEDFKKMEDPTYNNQKQFFEEDKNYIDEMYVEAEKLKKESKNYKLNDIDVNKFWQEPDDSYRKYDLVKNYSEAYKIAMVLNEKFTEEQKNDFKIVIKRIEHCYYMAYRMCRKLEDYKKKHPFNGDVGLWEKDKKMKEIKYHADLFIRNNKERIKK